MPRQRRLISFDWAMNKLLQSKANFDILEGFLSELLKDDITILEILESESNQEDAKDKFNRVDLKVRNQRGKIVIIEVQYEMEFDYLQRILYGTSRVITEHIDRKVPYSEIASLDEWIYFLKNEEIQDSFQAKGLKKAKQELDILKLPDKERLAYV